MGLLVIGVYIIAGSSLIFTDYFTVVPQNYRTGVGTVVLLYGGMRAARYYIKREKNA
jgi:hypothetical protein